MASSDLTMVPAAFVWKHGGVAAMGVHPRSKGGLTPKSLFFKVFRIYAGYALGLFLLQRWMLFPAPHAGRPPVALRLVKDAERWTVPVDGGEVEAFFLPPHGPTPAPAVVFTHGNGELADDWIEPLTAYTRLGFAVLVPEYPGYGRSGGTPTEAAIRDVLVRFHDRLRARPEVDPARIVLHGRSVGGGAACVLAKERPPAALVLQSTFTSVRDLASGFAVPGFLVRDPFDNAAVVAAYDGPVFLAHGTRDSIIPFSHGNSLAEAARKVRFVSYDADHNDCPPSWSEYMGEVERFLRDAEILH